MTLVRFTRGASFYQIAPAYAGGDGYVGLRDGRVVARGLSPVEVARALLAPFAERTRGSASS